MPDLAFTTSDALKYAPPQMDGDAVVIDLAKANGKTYWSFAPDQDVIFIGAGTTGTTLKVDGARNVVVLGGDFKPDATAITSATLSFANISGDVYIEGVHIDNAATGERDGIGIAGAAGHSPSITIQDSLIENISGSRDGVHGDMLQTYGSMNEIRLFNVTGSSNYQGIFIPPQSTDGNGSATLENVNLKYLPSDDPHTYLLWFYDDTSEKQYPIDLTNVYVEQRPGVDPGSTGVWPSVGTSADQSQDQITWPSLPITGYVTVGDPPTDFVQAKDVGANYDVDAALERVREASVVYGGASAGYLADDSGAHESTGDHVVDNPKDVVVASVSYTLSDSVENLTLTGAQDIDGTGNGLNNVIIGNDGANALSGLAGNDNLQGNGGDDTLDGGWGSDHLDGGAGADTMIGGDGDDTYVVDDAGDTIWEWNNFGKGGVDTVLASIDYTLGNNIENLTLTGTHDLDGTGNALDNVIIGNEGANALSGLAGNDHLQGGGGNDALDGGWGDDHLDGGAGADTMIGGDGNDTYVVDDGGDSVVEWSNYGKGGVDTVLASIDYTLGNNIENLTLIGDATTGTGNTLNNVMTGNEADNVLSGLAGNDTLVGGNGADRLDGGAGQDRLDGGAGDDILTGGTGSDTFVVSLDSGHDTIVDFKHQGSELDVIEFDGVFDNFADLTAHSAQVGNDVVISVDESSTLTLRGVSLASLTPDALHLL